MINPLLDHKKTFYKIFFILSIVIIFYFATYDLHRTYHFAGDQGDTAQTVRNIYLGKEFPLLGRPSAIGGFHFGPAYYYILLLPYILFRFNPLAGGYFTCFFNLISFALLLWYLSKYLKIGILPLIALWSLSLFYPVFWILRTQWDPNLLPGTVTLFLLASILYSESTKVVTKVIFGGLIGLSIAFALQMHPTAFPLGYCQVFYANSFRAFILNGFHGS
jgi:hypothetical protein